MTSNHTMIHHIQPWNLYSCGGICTRSGLHRRPPSLVAFHMCYLFDHASIYEMSTLMTRFHYIIKYFHPLWRSCSLYIVRSDDHMWHMSIIPIHGHCTLMYLGLLHVYLQSHARIYHCIVPMSGLLFHSSLHYSTCRMDIMYFGHHVTPLTSYMKGYLL